jgi:Domain related to MnhB subunit of Na+/H+ antiporter
VLVPLAFGGTPLEHAVFETDLPVLGHVKTTSALAFDVGVYLLVLGLVFMVFESFGDEPRPASGEPDRAADESPRPQEVPAS